ncbi:hypothetical protein HK101_004811 [Irineochytrium annulatum]|nr:hypothetical protein HK101_004811 [Irineochytrium annulatum]
MWNEIRLIENLTPLVNLRILTLADNQITTLNDANLASLTKLKLLDLSRNQIEKIEPGQLPSTLQHLLLISNPCSHAPDHRLRLTLSLPDLRELDEVKVTREERRLARMTMGDMDERLGEIDMGRDGDDDGGEPKESEESESDSEDEVVDGGKGLGGGMKAEEVTPAQDVDVVETANEAGNEEPPKSPKEAAKTRTVSEGVTKMAKPEPVEVRLPPLRKVDSVKTLVDDVALNSALLSSPFKSAVEDIIARSRKRQANMASEFSQKMVDIKAKMKDSSRRRVDGVRQRILELE